MFHIGGFPPGCNLLLPCLLGTLWLSERPYPQLDWGWEQHSAFHHDECCKIRDASSGGYSKGRGTFCLETKPLLNHPRCNYPVKANLSSIQGKHRWGPNCRLCYQPYYYSYVASWVPISLKCPFRSSTHFPSWLMPFIHESFLKASLNCPSECPETSHYDDWHPHSLLPQRLKKTMKSRQHRSPKAWRECCHFSNTAIY